jgi:GT2 family glycosyltransferase
MIPVLGVPILNRPDLLYKMIDSIDVEVERLLIIDNGGVVAPSTMNKAERVITPGQNLGVAASWNHIMAETLDAPWWAIINSDIVFAPGDLDRLAKHMDNSTGLEGMVATLGSFSAFGINQAAVIKAGTFDENFHPAYFEDNDYQYRCVLTGVQIAGLPAGLAHQTSSTIASSNLYRDQNYRTFGVNSDYYRIKWGGSPLHEKYTTPFDRGGEPRIWELDAMRVESLKWRMDEP